MSEKRGKQPSKKTRRQLALVAIILLIIAAIVLLPYIELPSNESKATIAVTLIDEAGNEITYDASQRLTLLTAKAYDIFIGEKKISAIRFTLKVRIVYTDVLPATPKISWTAPLFSLLSTSPPGSRVDWGPAPATPFVTKDLPSGTWVDITSFNVDAATLDEKIGISPATWSLLVDIKNVTIEIGALKFFGSGLASVDNIKKGSFTVSMVEVNVSTSTLTLL